jgi:AraC-like DNA-binding protein
MDLMSRAMETLRLRAAHYRRDVLETGAALAQEDAGLHWVQTGRALLKLQGGRLELGTGDLVLVARPAARVLTRLSGEGSGRALVLSASFEFTTPDHPLLAALPAAIHVTEERLATNPQWQAHLASLLAELAAPADGSRALVARLTEITVVYALRLAPPSPQAECPNSGWLRGLHDPSLRPVLAAMHDAAGRAWTLAELAKLGGQSRSAFAAHFAAVMGEPPMTYLGRWRMFRARSLLRESELPMSVIAEQVGYGSAAAFSLAFSRENGVTPGAFRAEAREERAPAAIAYHRAAPERSRPAAAGARGRH